MYSRYLHSGSAKCIYAKCIQKIKKTVIGRRHHVLHKLNTRILKFNLEININSTNIIQIKLTRPSGHLEKAN